MIIYACVVYIVGLHIKFDVHRYDLRFLRYSFGKFLTLKSLHLEVLVSNHSIAKTSVLVSMRMLSTS
jgi:hypothetical protein